MIYVIASNNVKKVEELRRILNPLGITARTPDEIGISLDDVEETGNTFRENAELKARAAMEKSGYPAIADDSGLCVDALGGRPGVLSARYAENDEEKINKLISELITTEGDDRNAHFECAICCCFRDGETIFAEGRCDGTIGYAPRGTNGFGYDPIFFVEGNKTFAELTDNQKDAISHRGRALRDLSKKLSDKLNNKE